MKRDMDLVREILLACEAGEKHITSERSGSEVFNHVAKLNLAGLIISLRDEDGTAFGPVAPSYELQDLTWEGHNLLDTIRDQSLWSLAKRTVLQEGKSWTFELLKAWVTNELKKQFGIDPQ